MSYQNQNKKEKFAEKKDISFRGILILSEILLFVFVISACSNTTVHNIQSPPRSFQTSFESIDEFQDFYITPQNHMNSASHDRSSEKNHTGNYSHKGWIYAVNPPSTIIQNNNHRAYPSIQLYKLHGGAYVTPVMIELWVWLDVDLSLGEWFSFASLDHTTSTNWDAVLVNLSDQGFVHLMHVPYSSQGKRTFQTSIIKFPMKQWVKLSIIIHFDRDSGYAKVLQDDQLVSQAEVKRGEGFLTQVHLGLYAPPSLSNGVIFNDDLIIKEKQERYSWG